METWIGPAIIAAVISSIISVASWFANYRISVRLDMWRREEKIRDCQIALHAEIRSDLHHLDSIRFKDHYRQMGNRYAQDMSYSVLVPHPVDNLIFESMVDEIQVLPREVIDPITLYNRQYLAVASLVNDMRDPEFRSSPQDTRLRMYAYYIGMRIVVRDFAWTAVDALRQSLAKSGVSIPDVDLLARQSALAAEAGWEGSDP